LGFIGGKMIWDAYKESKEEEVLVHYECLTIPVLFFQAIATSIDALAVGVSFAALSINIVVAVSIIGITTAICCVVALLLGRRFGVALGNKATVVGGLVLIAIGIKALLF
jgi:putative Mn2+ efflux pump MntP